MNRRKPRDVGAGTLPGTRAMLVSGWSRPLVYDEADAAFIEASAWCLTNGYPSRRRNGKIEYLHILLMSPPDGKEVDHKNGDEMDARRTNLRVVTHKQNTQNLATVRSNSSSGYRGVSRCRRTGRWRAYATIGGRQKWLGKFDSPELAAEVAKSYRLRHMKGALA